MLAFSTFATAIVKDAVPGGLTIVSDGYEDAHPGFTSNTFFVLKDSAIQAPADLKGKKIGINAFGSAVDLDLRVYLKAHGIDPRRDVQVVEIAFGNMGAAIREKRIDCGVLVLPFKAAEEAKGDLRPPVHGRRRARPPRRHAEGRPHGVPEGQRPGRPRLPRRLHHGAHLVLRPGEPRQGAGHRLRLHEAAEGGARQLLSHAARLLPRPEWLPDAARRAGPRSMP